MAKVCYISKMVFMKKENIECADCDGYDGGYCDGG